METICISLGGSIISRRNGVNVSYIRKLLRVLKNNSRRYKFIITVGGGYASSLYVKTTRSIISNNSVLDQIGIAFTRINALIVKDLLTDIDLYPNVVTSLEELKMAASENEVVVMGGLLPGISTDAVAVLSCEVTNAKKLINVSKEAFVYDRPPSEPGAKRIPEMTHDQLINLAYKYDTRVAKSPFIFDLVASKLAKRGRISVYFINDDVNQLNLAIMGKKHNGTTVS
ncbi:MAG: UMP kinase [Candidatus Micrarchaeota archaeon]|nr:UMP kinase [Candidatus Micrarchaeota archaeon]